MAWAYKGPSLYSTAKWQALRKRIIARDGGVCQMCGCLTTTGRNKPTSAEVDHKRPHKGDPERFFDELQLWCLCKACHSSAKQSQDRGGRMQRRDGW